jgi:hypothetical protein
VSPRILLPRDALLLGHPRESYEKSRMYWRYWARKTSRYCHFCCYSYYHYYYYYYKSYY